MCYTCFTISNLCVNKPKISNVMGKIETFFDKNSTNKEIKTKTFELKKKLENIANFCFSYSASLIRHYKDNNELTHTHTIVQNQITLVNRKPQKHF